MTQVWLAQLNGWWFIWNSFQRKGLAKSAFSNYFLPLWPANTDCKASYNSVVILGRRFNWFETVLLKLASIVSRFFAAFWMALSWMITHRTPSPLKFSFKQESNQSSIKQIELSQSNKEHPIETAWFRQLEQLEPFEWFDAQKKLIVRKDPLAGHKVVCGL